MAAEILRGCGVPAGASLRRAGGWSNAVWLAPAHVLKVSSGRFRQSLAHEAATIRLLAPAVPHASVVANGVSGAREWLVLERRPGVTLAEAWPRLGPGERAAAGQQLGAILRALHQTPLPAGYQNPWLADALAPGGAARDAYHAPPEHYPALLEAAAGVPGVDAGVLREVEAFIRERLGAFDAEPLVLVHADVHCANLLWQDGLIMALPSW